MERTQSLTSSWSSLSSTLLSLSIFSSSFACWRHETFLLVFLIWCEIFIRRCTATCWWSTRPISRGRSMRRLLLYTAWRCSSAVSAREAVFSLVGFLFFSFIMSSLLSFCLSHSLIPLRQFSEKISMIPTIPVFLFRLRGVASCGPSLPFLRVASLNCSSFLY